MHMSDNGVLGSQHFESYFSPDLHASQAHLPVAACHKTLADGFICGLHQAQAFEDLLSFDENSLEDILKMMRQTCNRPTQSKIVTTLYRTILKNLDDIDAVRERDLTNYFVMGYQLAFLHAGKYDRAVFMKGSTLWKYVYGTLLRSDKQVQHVRNIGHSAYQRDITVQQGT